MINTEAWVSINELISRAAGVEDAQIVDDRSLVDFGRTLSNATSDTFKNNFAAEIANKVRLSINVVRKYEPKLESLIRGSMPANGVLEIIQHSFFDMRVADFVNVIDGQSVDMYKVNKGEQVADYFVDEISFKTYATIQDVELEGAFLSGDAMQAFIDGKIAYLINSYNLAREQCRRALIASEIKDLSTADAATSADGLAQRYPLVTLYNTIYGYTASDSGFVKKEDALYNANFVKFAVAMINKVYKKLGTPSMKFNDGSVKTFTPNEHKKMICLEALEDAIVAFKTTISPDATVLPDHDLVEFWQQEKNPYVAYFGDGANVVICNTDADRGKDTTKYYFVIATGKTWKYTSGSNYTEITDFDDGTVQSSTSPTVAVLYDDLALGEYVTHERTLTTPFNAAGEYYNIYMNYQGKLIRLKSANQVIFTLD